MPDEMDLLALYLSGTDCHKTGTRPPSCTTPRQPTINVTPNYIGKAIIITLHVPHLTLKLIGAASIVLILCDCLILFLDFATFMSRKAKCC